MKEIKTLNFIFFGILLIALCKLSHAQETESFENIRELEQVFGFAGYDPLEFEDPLEIVLEFDTRILRRSKQKEDYQEAVLGFYSPDGEYIRKNIRLRARGNYRKDFCDFPPIRISFKETGDTGHALIPAMKMVTHCKYADVFEQYILKEYLIYRMYNLISEYSYRVKLLRVTYRDTRGKDEPYSRLAMIIEPDELMEERLRGDLKEKRIRAMFQLDYNNIHILSLFQYMIGNTDWAVAPCHNIRILFFDEGEARRPVAVPFDFDYAGLVNTFYAIPREELEIGSVRERLYQGYCIQEEEFKRFFDYYNGMEETLLGMAGRIPLLEQEQKEDIIQYLEAFFTILKDEREARFHIIDACVH